MVETKAKVPLKCDGLGHCVWIRIQKATEIVILSTREA